MAGLIAVLVLAFILNGYLSPAPEDYDWVRWFHSQPGQWRFLAAVALLAVIALDDLGDKVKAGIKKVSK